MKKLLYLLLTALIVFASCNNNVQTGVHPDWSYNAVIYEMNIRQYTAEGTFAAAQEHLPRLKNLGVDVIWLMPVYPIGVKERKGTLGSYYAISDYCAINPEFGTMRDFRKFLDAAHQQGFKVILDWVANHTSPDAEWINKRPADWYVRDSAGNTIVQYDWTDIAKLNYDNTDMRKEMGRSMRFWLDQGIDGFRCDMACEVPLDFWREVIPAQRKDYPGIFFLAEGEDTGLHQDAFDASYTWELHHLMNAVAREEKTAADIKAYVLEDQKRMPRSAFRLMFTSNHDENSWAGSEYERMGLASHTMAMLTFVLPQGMPLIYTGQEIGLDRRLKFFEKDPIEDWTETPMADLYRSLIALRHDNPALASGEKGGQAVFPEDPSMPEQVLYFSREVKGNKVIVMANLSSNDVSFSFPLDGVYKEYLRGHEYHKGEGVTLPTWHWLIFVI